MRPARGVRRHHPGYSPYPTAEAYKRWRSGACDASRDRILVNCVAPGFTRTERVAEVTRAAAAREGVTADAVEARIVQQIPMGRLGDPTDLAHVIAFLASAGGDYVTGTTIPVDGGYLRGLL